MRALALRFSSRYALGIAGLLLVQQVIVASSSLWLVRFTASIQRGAWQPAYLMVFLLSLILPYAPGAGALFLTKLFELDSLERFWSERQTAILGRLDLRGHPEVRATENAIFVKDAPQLIQDLCLYYYNILSTGMNALLNVLAVSFLVSSWFVVSYLVSLLIAMALITFFARYNSDLSARAENAKVGLNRVLGHAWDNLTVNNTLNRRFWLQEKEEAYAAFWQAGIRASGVRDFSSVVLSLATFVPTLVTIGILASRAQGDAARLLSLTVLLPRIFMILNSTTMIIYLLRDHSTYSGRIAQIVGAMRLTAAESSALRIQKDLISMRENSTGENWTLERELPETGWLTLRGPNGAGKSSFLAELKTRLGERAYYYPAHAELQFGHESRARSTGQRTSEEIEIILSSCAEPVLLLDEWDANLDSERQAKIMALLAETARRRLVIDVRHRL